MANFEVKVYRINLEPHPDADALELAIVGDYRSAVRLGQFKDGDLAAYIPEASILPYSLIQEMGLEGRLAGSAANRVKAVRLRGVLSQGLVHPVPGAQEGDDVTEQLGITKYVPEIPSTMDGEIWNATGMTLNFDIENIKKYPGVLREGEPVVITEKLHGTCCQLGFYHGQPLVTQKGWGATGLALKDNENNDRNIYVQTFRKHLPEMEALRARMQSPDQSFYVLGEIYGRGVQDLQYDGLNEKHFRVFDVYLGDPGSGRYLNHQEMVDLINPHFEAVPVVYRGPYKPEALEENSTGQSLIADHLREGTVIRPQVERNDLKLGRVILKSVSADYLLRKGKNLTEYE